MSEAIMRDASVSYHISLQGIITRINVPGCQLITNELCNTICQHPELPPICNTIQTYLVAHK